MSSDIGAVSKFILFILVFTVSVSLGTSRGHEEEVLQGGSGGRAMKPLKTPPGLEKLVLNATRRRLSSFRICALCTCCGGPSGFCILSPCCYAINCNIPNRPFGFCSFTPRSCNCFGCHL